MTDSRWRAGTGQGDDYSPWYKYDLTLRPLDEDGAIAWDRTPVEALNVKLHPESRRFWKAEVHHRFDAACEEDLVHTIRQSQDLLAQHAADVDTEGAHQDNKWLEAKLTTRDWEHWASPTSTPRST